MYILCNDRRINWIEILARLSIVEKARLFQPEVSGAISTESPVFTSLTPPPPECE